MVRICDGRMSGTAYGTVVLHVAPEAAAGGPLGAGPDRRLIVLDVADRRLDVDVDPATNSAGGRRTRATVAASPQPQTRLGTALRRPRHAGRHRRRPRLPAGIQRRQGGPRVALSRAPAGRWSGTEVLADLLVEGFGEFFGDVVAAVEGPAGHVGRKPPPQASGSKRRPTTPCPAPQHPQRSGDQPAPVAVLALMVEIDGGRGAVVLADRVRRPHPARVLPRTRPSASGANGARPACARAHHAADVAAGSAVIIVSGSGAGWIRKNQWK